MGFFISNLAAQTTTAATATGAEAPFSLLMVLGIFVLFYFMLIRPQSKRAKEHRALVDSVKKGDEVILNSGMLAKVVDLGDQYLKVTITEGVEVMVQRGAVMTILPKGTLKTL